MKSIAYSVSTTRVLIVPADNINRTVYTHVQGAGTVYVGGNDVTSSNGMRTEKHSLPFTIFIPAGEQLWAITASGTEDVRVLTPSVD
jgi:hypothetical protein